MKFLLSSLLTLITGFSFAQSISQISTDPVDSIFQARFPQVYAEVGHQYPPFEFKKGNKIVNNNILQGKVVLINFWFEGCMPCMAEMEALDTVFQKMKSNKDFVFISIAKENQEAIKRVKKKYSLSFDAFSATEQECKRLNFGSGYPTSIILDKTGIIRYIHVGGSIEKEDASDRIMSVLLPELQSLL